VNKALMSRQESLTRDAVFILPRLNIFFADEKKSAACLRDSQVLETP